MDTLSYKTISANKATVTKEWVIVDATDQTLGRLGAKVAKLLRGKYKPNFTPHVDCGDNVIIIICRKDKSLEGRVGYVACDSHKHFCDDVVRGFGVFLFMKHFFCTDFKISYGIVYLLFCYIVERVNIFAVFNIHLCF